MRTETRSTARISVVIPAYNAAKHLPAAIQSVLSQSGPPGEIIVVDDGSSDDTVAVAHSFGVQVISVPNGGPSAARNAGTRAASGEFIAYLDADDMWAPEKLTEQLTTLEGYGRPAFSFTDYRMFDESGPFREKSELLRRPAFRKSVGNARRRATLVMAAGGNGPVLYDSYIMPSSLMVRRQDIFAVGGFDETLRVSEDYEFCLRLFRVVPAVVIMKPLVLYRQHAAQATSNSALMRAGFFDVARRVAADPSRYPAGDVRYLAKTQNLREFSVGLQQARVGHFDEAVSSFRRSLAARWTVGASVALLGSQVCWSRAGRLSFTVVRGAWKRRWRRR
jgi:glycosyltransferase involved in cell wall biosynthesis